MRIALAAALLATAACTAVPPPEAAAPAGERTVAPVLLTEEARDPHSYARPEIARVTHVALDLDLDFEAERVAGTALLDVAARPGADRIVLDSKGLEILSVADAAGRPLQWSLDAADPNLGAPLAVELRDDTRRIAIRYRSAPNAAALQWLDPEQTAGGDHRFLFSQGQAILNRTWIPTQDSPGIRQTWEARVTAPEPLTVVMSGENLDPDGEPAGPGRRAFRFREPNPVAPYLIAIAAGDIEFRSLGPRSGVWAEPELLDEAAAEFADTERMIDAAEALYGPYRWGRYDMIVLPPAFPFGGMENPRLTFLTPTMIAGDKSLVSLIAHELAHSWSGNLVTNASWADFWLNEGFTSYFENRIMEALYGEKRAEQEAALAWAGLEADVAEAGADAASTRLHIDLSGEDPDEGMTSIAYDKGALFLRTIERTVGRERWDRYLRGWFDRHAFEPATSAMFLADLRANLLTEAEARRLDIDQWVYGTGIPANAAIPDPAAFAEVDAAVRAFAAGGAAGAVPYRGWTTAERLRFLNSIPRELPQARLAELDRAFALTASENAETLFAWLNLALANRYEPAVPAAERFLASVGRRKFVAPLFETLAGQGDWGRTVARRIYQRARPTYHAVTRGTVDETLGWTG